MYGYNKHTNKYIRTLLATAMLMMATVLAVPLRGQTLRDYEFSTGVDASKWKTATNWTTIFTSSDNGNLASGVLNIGFPFPFGSGTYTQFSVNTKGNFRLGPEATANWKQAGLFTSAYYTRNYPKISGVVSDDGFNLGSNGYIRYALTGTAPTRVFVCEYRVNNNNVVGSEANMMWQVQLYEATGEVAIVYGSTDLSAPAYCPHNYQTGLATSPTDIVVLPPNTHMPVYSTTYNETLYYTWHGTNRYYSFMLPSSTCPRPESIAISDIGPTWFTATWVDNSGSTQWEVRLDRRNVQGTPVVVNTPSYTFSGLTNGTDYSVRVRGICGPGDTTAVRSLPVQTLCGYLPLPYSEGFEDALATSSNVSGNGQQNNLPNCWDYHNEGSDYSFYPCVKVGSGLNFAHSGTNYMRSYVNTSSSYKPQYAFLPLTDPIQHPVNSLELRYWIRCQNSSPSHPGTCIVGITPDPTDISTFIPVNTVTYNSITWSERTVQFNNYTGPHGRVTILFPKQTGHPNWTFIDDIYLFFHNSFDTVTHTACNSYTWPENGTTYTNSGTYNTTLPNAAGYDSIITLQLTIYHSYADDTTAAVCDSITWRGNYYSESGNYIDTIFLSPLVGCDSTATLHLTVNHRSGLPAILPGSTESHFSVSSTQTVQFSKGNLQYQASTGLWRFAEHQYDYVGDDNTNISSTYDGWIDLFGWGTSGWNSGATEYQPYSSFANSNRYQPGGNASNDLTGSYAEADWGWHNAIQNGGNRNHLWRTLIHTEWEYLFNTRTTNTNLGTPNARYAKASVNGTKGVILFPDEYTHPANVAVPLGINATDNTGWDGNTYSTTDWDKMDSAGAVFLPAARMRNGTALTNIGLLGGYYWAADRYNDNNSHAHMLKFNNTSFDPSHHNYRYLGISVRPVHNTDPVIPNDTVAEACDSFSWWNTNYTNSTNTPTHLYTTTAGCDSLVTLHLTINHSSTGDTTATACDSFTWWGTTYTSSTNTATHTFTNAAGCDSVVTLHLTIYHSYAGDTTAVVCDSITWRGNYYSESGNYIDTISLSPLVGCDSTATLHLTVNHRSGLPAILPGSTESHFSVSSTQTVQFSKGNLQYQASTGLWRFAEHQYDYVGSDNHNISSTYDGWIDLFGWGTSGWNSGATAYQPYSFSNNPYDYRPGNNAYTDLTGSYAEADWGWHNAIQNGGNRNHLWRTLIHTEWEYLFNTRTTNTNLGTPNARYAKASVNGTHGVILFPDEYTHPADVTVPVGINATDNTGWDGNSYSTTDWSKMDSAGAVFLPVAGSRSGVTYFNSGPTSFYWAADRYISNNTFVHNIKFNRTSLDPSQHSNRYFGYSVRPVHNTDPVTTNDTIAEACDSFTWWNTNYTNCTNTPTHLYSTTAGCDSLVTLHLTINLSTTGDTTATACDSFTWWGTTYTSSTNTATHTFTNAAGCDSVVTLHLTINHSNTGDTTATACDNFSWRGTNYTNSTNSATHTFTNAAGCDSVVTLHLIVNHSNTGDTTATACNSFTWWGNSYTNLTNAATHTFTNAAGCDSVVTLHLTVNHSTTGDTTATACNSFTWWGTNYTSSTNAATHTFTNAAGCDSVVTLHLTVNHSTTGDTTATACNSLTWWGTTYTNSTNTATHSFTNAAGCDSVVTLHLTINHSNSGDTTATACNSFTWWGTSHTSSTNAATHTYTNAAGCDSIVMLHLTVNYSNTGIEDTTVCNNIVWHGTEYTTSTNTPTFTCLNAVGCDSVTTLHLTVNHCSTTPITVCDSYSWRGHTYTTTGIFIDGTDTLNLTINHSNTGDTSATACGNFTWWGNSYTSSTNIATHTFTNAAGCDSVVTLHLTMNQSNTGDTTATACNSFTWWGNSYTNSTNSATHPFINAAGCDSVVTLHLTINHSNTGDTTVTACNSFNWWGNNYASSTNSATHTFTNAAGCDSVVTLHLTVNHSNTGDTTVTACNSFTWWGNSHTSSTNTATHTFTNAAGCDSIVTLHLTINHSNTGDTTVTACNSFTWWGINYTSSTNAATHTFTNAAGCDSVVTLHLTINQSITGDTTATTCDSFTWWGTNYTSSTNTATHTFTTAAGCDSVVTLHLTMNYSNTGIEDTTVCNSFVWHGTEYTTSTSTPTFTCPNAAGCDSVTTLHLTVIQCSSTLVTVCDSYSWRGHTYTTTGIYIDGTDTLNLTVGHSNTGDTSATACDSFTWWGNSYTSSTNTATHTFTNAAGCDSVVTLHLTVNHSSIGDTTATACNSFTWWGTNYTNSTNVATHTYTNATGCDSVITLHLTINHSNTGDTTATACDSFTWWGTNYTNSTNSVTHIFTNVNGCDSVVTLNLTVNYSNTGIEDTTVCNSFVWHGTEYTTSTNTPTFTCPNAAGCDSVTTLHLTVNHCSTTPITVCDSYTWRGHTYTATGIYIDGTDTLNLTVGHSTTGDTTATACDSFTWWNTNYTNSTNTATHTFTNAAGCDSVVTLHLTINSSNTGDTTATACDSFTWWGTNYTNSTNTATHTFTNAAGCDSVVTLHLTLNLSTDSTVMDTVTENELPYLFHGLAHGNDTTLTITIPNTIGCDSVVTLNLTVVRNVVLTIDSTICESLLPFTWNDSVFYSAGTKQRTLTTTLGTDSTITMSLNVIPTAVGFVFDTIVENSLPYSFMGHLYTSDTVGDTLLTTAHSGCDSLVVFNLHIHHNVATSTDSTVCTSQLPLSWNGVVFTAAGVETATLQAVSGADSVVTMTVAVSPDYLTTDTMEVCSNVFPLTWRDTTFAAGTISGHYTRSHHTAAGCDSTLVLNLTIFNPAATIDIISSCEALVWIDGNTYSHSTDSATFTLQTLHGCDSTVTLHFEMLATSHTSIADSFCAGTEYLFGALTLTEGGQYSDTLTAANSCDSIVDLSLTKLSLPTIRITTSSDCNSLLHNIHAETDVNHLYWSCSETSWNNSWGSQSSHDLTIGATQPLTLTLLADYHETPTCPNTAQVTLQPIVQPHAVMTVTPEFLTTDAPTLLAISQSTGANRLQWYLDGDDAGSEPSITYTPPFGSDSVVVTLMTFSDLCSDTTEKTIYIKQQTLYVPNAFTPNESTNNTFSIFFDGIVEYELYIYSRQGILIYHSTTNGDAWDGRYKGQPCPQGAYVWLVRYRSEVDPRNWHTQKGTVTLIY